MEMRCHFRSAQGGSRQDGGGVCAARHAGFSVLSHGSSTHPAADTGALDPPQLQPTAPSGDADVRNPSETIQRRYETRTAS